jgi:hypothetical protein
MFDFQQVPSRTGGTISRLDDGDVVMQVAFHTGECNSGFDFLRISGAVTVGDVQRFSTQYHMTPSATPYIEDVAIDLRAIAIFTGSTKDRRHAA